MSRRSWRYVIVAVLVAALVGVGYSVSRRASVSELVEKSFLASEALPELLQRIRNFHRVITREGRKVLEVSASEASYFKNDKAIEIVAPKVVFYEGGERVGEVSASRGRLYLDGTDVQSVEVSGEVLFELGRMRVMTDNLTYDKATNHINAHGVVRVAAAELDLTGTDMSVDMLNRGVVINTGVSMTLRPRTESPS